MVCLCLALQTLKDNTKLIEQNRAYIDIVELRVDVLEPPAQVWEKLERWAEQTIGDFHLPIIFTIRLPHDGGSWKDSEEKRIRFLLQAAASPVFQYVDIEQNIASLSNTNPTIEDILGLAHQDTTLILSEHHWAIKDGHTNTEQSGQNEYLSDQWASQIIATSETYPHCIIKSAVFCNSSDAMCRFFEQSLVLYNAIPNKYIVVSMGAFGLLGRILRAITGSLLTFTSDASSPLQTQLGHISPHTLIDTYQYRYITRNNTDLYGVVGNPVLHSLSPALHNNYFKEAGLQALSEHRKNKVYIHIPLDEPTQIPRLAKCINLKGASITIPHKHSVLAILDEMDDIVRQCQSCNTIVINSQKKWRGYNTDIAGFVAPLNTVLDKTKKAQKNTRAHHNAICIIGAGGVAKGIAYALLQKGYNILIVNRTIENAKTLAAALSQQWADSTRITTAHISDYETIKAYAHIIVQTTSVGMDTSLSPLPEYPFVGTEIVYDVIYTPPITTFMQDAMDKGCTVISGKEMFYEQGYLQSQLFMPLKQ